MGLPPAREPAGLPQGRMGAARLTPGGPRRGLTPPVASLSPPKNSCQDAQPAHSTTELRQILSVLHRRENPKREIAMAFTTTILVSVLLPSVMLSELPLEASPMSLFSLDSQPWRRSVILGTLTVLVVSVTACGQPQAEEADNLSASLSRKTSNQSLDEDPCTMATPTLSVSDAVITLQCGDPWEAPEATATGACGQPLEVHRYNTGDDDQDGIPAASIRMTLVRGPTRPSMASITCNTWLGTRTTTSREPSSRCTSSIARLEWTEAASESRPGGVMQPTPLV